MLGATGSGKTTFMLGMYAELSAGREGYFVYAPHDDHVELMDAWDRLNEEGELPPPNDERSSRAYVLTFRRGLDGLLMLNWLDYRGGAMSDRMSAPDTSKLIRQLAQSDSIYLVLDGKLVGQWVKAQLDAMQNSGRNPTVQGIRRSLHVEDMTTLLQSALHGRPAGQPRPSVVVIITKLDTLETITGLRQANVLQIIASRLGDLLPVALADGITCLINPVQLGDFGTEQRPTVDVASIDPKGFSWPFIFTFSEYLNSQIAAVTLFLDTVQREFASTEAEIVALRRGFGGGIFKRGRIQQLTDAQAARVGEARAYRERLVAMQREATRLTADLNGRLIIRNGMYPR
jgi:Double-GTPase 2